MKMMRINGKKVRSSTANAVDAYTGNSSMSKPASKSVGQNYKMTGTQYVYCQQCSFAPVSVPWKKWNKDTLAYSRRNNFPVLLYIGYKGSSWCNIMKQAVDHSPEQFLRLLDNGSDNDIKLRSQTEEKKSLTPFVPVCVDSEVRPDVSDFFISFVHSLHGTAGWPMFVLLTPDFRPFVGGTFDPVLVSRAAQLHANDGNGADITGDYDYRGGGVGSELMQLLNDLSNVWQKCGGEIIESSDQSFRTFVNTWCSLQQDTEYQLIRERMVESESSSIVMKSLEKQSDIASDTQIEPKKGGRRRRKSTALKIEEKCYKLLDNAFDAYCGGFSNDPKSYSTSSLSFLIEVDYTFDCETHGRRLRQLNRVEPQVMVERTLEAIMNGGVYDHIGGGFFRNSIDSLWHVPDLEKTLRENAQLVNIFVEAWNRYGSYKYVTYAKSALDYILNNLRAPEGGFYSGHVGGTVSEDGSLEFDYYAWTDADIRSCLIDSAKSATDGSSPWAEWNEREVEAIISEFCKQYSICKEGNCNVSAGSDLHGWYSGINFPRVSSCNLMESHRNEKMIAYARKLLYDKRHERRSPDVCKIVQTQWNAVAISSFSKASICLPRTEELFPVNNYDSGAYLEEAIKVANFILEKIWNESDESLKHSFKADPRNEDVNELQYASDYMAVVNGFLDLFQVSGITKYLDLALKIQRKSEELFWDESCGGFFETEAKSDFLIPRRKITYEGLGSCATSVGAMNMLRLSNLLPSNDYRSDQLYKRSMECVKYFEVRLLRSESSAPKISSVACALRGKPSMLQIIIVGYLQSESMTSMIQAAHRNKRPYKTIIPVGLDDVSRQYWNNLNPSFASFLYLHTLKENDAIAIVSEKDKSLRNLMTDTKSLESFRNLDPLKSI